MDNGLQKVFKHDNLPQRTVNQVFQFIYKAFMVNEGKTTMTTGMKKITLTTFLLTLFNSEIFKVLFSCENCGFPVKKPYQVLGCPCFPKCWQF